MARKNENPTPLEEANEAEPKPQKQLPSAFSLFMPSYDALLVNIWTFVGLLLAPYIVIFLSLTTSELNSFGLPTGNNMNLLLLAYAILLFVAPAMPYLHLKSVKGEEVSIGEALRAGLKMFWRFYGLAILVVLAVLLGFLLFIVPGFFMFRRYVLAQYYLYDRNVGIREAMKLSAEESKLFSGAVWGMIGVSLLIGMPSVVPIVGVFVTYALTFAYLCAPALRYFQIKNAVKA